MRTLVLMRHATAGIGPPGSDDRDRVISSRGHREAEAAAAWLGSHGWGPGPTRTVLASAATRARQTAEYLGGPLVADRHLYNAGTQTLLEAIQWVADDPDTVVLVAHNPGVHRLAWELAESTAPARATVVRDGGSRPGPLSSFAPATMAIFTVSAPWPQLGPGQAGLQQVIRPATG